MEQAGIDGVLCLGIREGYGSWTRCLCSVFHEDGCTHCLLCHDDVEYVSQEGEVIRKVVRSFFIALICASTNFGYHIAMCMPSSNSLT